MAGEPTSATPSTGDDDHGGETEMRFKTVLTHLSRPGVRIHGFVNPPVQRGSTVIFPTVKARNDSWHQRKRFEQELTYGICGTQTHFALEDLVARIEGGTRCQITSSGLCACTIAILSFLKAGDHVLLPDSVYGPVRGFADGFLRRFGVEVEYYHARATVGELEASYFKSNTRVLYIESPGSHSFELVDVKAFARLARARGVKSVLDNTYGIHFFKPFATGEVDVSVQALTKYVNGHSDALLGAITVANDGDWTLVRETTMELGEVASPDDCFLALRGARTLACRLEAQMKAGLAVAEWLEKQPEVLRVLHPALPSCPGHEFYQRDFSGCPSLFSVVFQGFSDAACHAMIDSYKLFAIGASWGGFESLVLPATFFRTVAQPDHLTEGPAARYHVGLEDVADLIADLAQGLAVMRAFDDGGGQAAGAAAKSDRAMASSSGSGSGEVPPTIYHLASKAEWEAAVAAQRDYFTESLEKEGITHTSGNTKLLVTIANAFYKTCAGDFVLLTVETGRLKSEVKLVQADAPLPGSESKEPPRCPHIFGPIELDAVVKVSAVTRAEDGTFLSMEGI